MVRARKYVVAKFFEGFPKRDDFQIVEYDLPPLRENEILTRTEWISVDPYHRIVNTADTPVPYDQFGHQIGTVLETRNPYFPVGTRVFSHVGWCDYAVLDPSVAIGDFDKVTKLKELQGFPYSLYLGALGMVGATAYFGLIDVCKPKVGETVVVSAAGGGVGSIVGQIAKLMGCYVIGITGSDGKVDWLEQELGFNKCFNYKKVGITEGLQAAAPNGVDCYFDNVGGELSSQVLYSMNPYGRVCVCGSISGYNNQKGMEKATPVQSAVMSKVLTMQGFTVSKYIDRWHVSQDLLLKWLSDGRLKAGEYVTHGFGSVYDAFVGMLKGQNYGKAVVKLF